MNNSPSANNRLLFINMTLQARLDIRDFFLKNAVREIYENIGQVLSVVRMQLAVLDANDKSETDETTHSPGHLVGQSIRDLRAMCKSFYPDTDLINDEGFTEAFENTIEILFQNTRPAVKVKGVRKDIQPEMKLIVFKMMQEILIAIKETGGKYIGLIISYTKDEVEFAVSYHGSESVLNIVNTSGVSHSDLTLQQRTQVIGAKLTSSKSKTDTIRIKLISPLKSLYNE